MNPWAGALYDTVRALEELEVRARLSGERYCVNITWDEVPHLSQQEKDDLWTSLQPHERRQRSKGLPVLGSGLVYPFEEEFVRCPVVPLLPEWPRCFGLDTDGGAGFTAMVWLALDRERSLVYIYEAYKSPSISKNDHIEKLRSMGTKQQPLWIPGVGDAKGLLVTEEDSMQVIELYQNAGVDIEYPDKSVEAGIREVIDLIQLKRLRVFETCTDWFAEFRQYHRKDGKIVKQNDHLMDATRYAIRSGLGRAKLPPVNEDEVKERLLWRDADSVGLNWLGN